MTNILKYIIIGTIIFLIYKGSFGNTVSGVYGHIDNVYYGGFVAGETQYQNQAIAFLCNEHLKNYYPEFEGKVFLELGFSEIADYKLSYDKYQGKMWENAEHNRPTEGFGIRIRLSKKFNRAESVLKLLEYGLKNLSILEQESIDFYSLDYSDRSNDLTIEPEILSNTLTSSINERIKNTLAIKVFRNLGEIDVDTYKEYYFQNDKFYLINFMNNDSVYLELAQIYQTIMDYYMGTIIFETDSTGYFYSRENKRLSQKFMIKNKHDSFYYTKTSTNKNKKRIYFEYESYEFGRKKFIYLTNDLILIQKVEQYEDEMIEKARKANKG